MADGAAGRLVFLLSSADRPAVSGTIVDSAGWPVRSVGDVVCSVLITVAGVGGYAALAQLWLSCAWPH